MQTLQIKNSTAEFLIFTKQNKEKTIEVIVDEESVCKEFLHTASDDKNYKTKYYNLDVIIAVDLRSIVKEQ